MEASKDKRERILRATNGHWYPELFGLLFGISTHVGSMGIVSYNNPGVGSKRRSSLSPEPSDGSRKRQMLRSGQDGQNSDAARSRLTRRCSGDILSGTNMATEWGYLGVLPDQMVVNS